MQSNISRPLRFLIMFLLNFVIIVSLAYGFEYFLKLTKPDCKLPFDTEYFLRYRTCYDFSDFSKDVRYTWGHKVVINRFGFRERDFAVPKSQGVCRIMVLGDSLTWGVGVSVEERYTNLVENKLHRQFLDRQFEVLNFAQTGLSTIEERDILQEYGKLTDPDLIVVAFYENDPQPKSQSYNVERERFDKKYGFITQAIFGGLIKADLPYISKVAQTALNQILRQVGITPPYEIFFQRVYETDSAEWIEFKKALLEIKALSDDMNLPPPIFAVLNLGSYLAYPKNDIDEDKQIPIQLRWNHQAEEIAAEIGFTTYSYEQEFLQHRFPYSEIRVNSLDAHPSAKIHSLYAQKLFEQIVIAINSGRLCSETYLP